MKTIMLVLTILMFCCTASGLASNGWNQDMNTSEVCKSAMESGDWPGFWLGHPNFPEGGFNSLGHCVSWAQKNLYDALGFNPRKNQEWCGEGVPVVYVCKWLVFWGAYENLGSCIKEDWEPPCD
jgi:hypothetical protein